MNRSVSKMKLPIWIFLILIILGGVYYLLNTRKPNSAVKTANSAVGTVVPQGNTLGKQFQAAVTQSANKGEVVIEGSSYSFSPSSFTVKAGEKVKLTFKNIDGFHDLVFETLDIGTKQIKAGQSETLEFTAPETKGSYVFYCSVGNHRDMGMVGKMIVE